MSANSGNGPYNKAEIILNLWFVHDVDGFIYSLRGRAYLGYGSDAEKLGFLQQFAKKDYLIAQPFPIPNRFWVMGKAVTHQSRVPSIGSSGLFEEVFKALNDALPSQTPFNIPTNPLTCITPLLGDDDGNIRPHFSEQELV